MNWYLNFMLWGNLHCFHFSSFRIVCDCKGSFQWMNLHEEQYKVLQTCSGRCRLDVSISFGLATESPNVMMKNWKMSCSTFNGDISFVCFAYGYVLHDCYRFIEDLLKINRFREILKKSVAIASFFKCTHLVRTLLDSERSNIKRQKQLKIFPLRDRMEALWSCVPSLIIAKQLQVFLQWYDSSCLSRGFVALERRKLERLQ